MSIFIYVHFKYYTNSLFNLSKDFVFYELFIFLNIDDYLLIFFIVVTKIIIIVHIFLLNFFFDKNLHKKTNKDLLSKYIYFYNCVDV